MKNHVMMVRHLVKRYGHFQLGPVTLDLSCGTAYGLLGPNGAGKTTLLNCMAGQSRLNCGRIYFEHQEVLWGDWRVRERIGFLRETPLLYDELSVEQTLRFASCMYPTWDRDFVRSWQERLRLDGRKKVRHLSRGMRVKLAILAGLAHGSRLLLLDEPTAGLDPEGRADLQSLLRELVRERGACLLLSSHLFEDMELSCDEIKILREGRIIHECRLGDPESISLRQLYFDRR